MIEWKSNSPLRTKRALYLGPQVPLHFYLANNFKAMDIARKNLFRLRGPMTSSQLILINENLAKLQKNDRVVGFYLYGSGGESIAKIEGILVESGIYLPRYLAITLGGFLKIEGKKVIIPIEVCEVADLGKVKTEWRKESLIGAPNPVNLEDVTQEEEELILGYFDLEPYWAANANPQKSKEENPRPETGTPN